MAGMRAIAIAATPAVVPSASTYTVLIDNMKFSPAVIRMRPGETVIFKNIDLVPHTVTEKDTRRFDSGMINRNGMWKFVAAGKGTLNYRCTYHTDMTGTIVVETVAQASSNPAPAVVELCGAP